MHGTRMTDFNSLQQANLFRWAYASVDAWVILRAHVWLTCWLSYSVKRAFWGNCLHSLMYDSRVDYRILASELFETIVCITDVWLPFWLSYPGKRNFWGGCVHSLMYESCVDYRNLASVAIFKWGTWIKSGYLDDITWLYLIFYWLPNRWAREAHWLFSWLPVLVWSPEEGHTRL